MQEIPQAPVSSRIVCGIHGLVVLAEELGAFSFGQIPKDYLGIAEILITDRLR